MDFTAKLIKLLQILLIRVKGQWPAQVCANENLKQCEERVCRCSRGCKGTACCGDALRIWVKPLAHCGSRAYDLGALGERMSPCAVAHEFCRVAPQSMLNAA